MTSAEGWANQRKGIQNSSQSQHRTHRAQPIRERGLGATTNQRKRIKCSDQSEEKDWEHQPIREKGSRTTTNQSTAPTGHIQSKEGICEQRPIRERQLWLRPKQERGWPIPGRGVAKEGRSWGASSNQEMASAGPQPIRKKHQEPPPQPQPISREQRRRRPISAHLCSWAGPSWLRQPIRARQKRAQEGDWLWCRAESAPCRQRLAQAGVSRAEGKSRDLGENWAFWGKNSRILGKVLGV